MSVYVDTSALYALLDADNIQHSAARDAWVALMERSEELLCSSYVLVESFALVQARLGLAAVRTLQNDLLPVVAVHWVDQTLHEAAVSALLTAGREQLSLVDCVSFELMRRLGLRTAFTFDRHFGEQGFGCLPTSA